MGGYYNTPDKGGWWLGLQWDKREGTDSVSINPQGFPWWHSTKEPICPWRRPGLNPWIRKIPRKRKWEPTPVFLPGKSHQQRRMSGCSPWGQKSWNNLATEQQVKSPGVGNGLLMEQARKRRVKGDLETSDMVKWVSDGTKP